ncbi:MAG: GWxTD domain-containing protein [Flavobacteriales bacterium]|jgi:GWxTD domain-containing protein|nr:GWxTD domain-containing protein [Flavobacteriales bacterium]MBK7943739.1 GWxTD domain-containing protein [Flavobacteriales bacterium]MBK9699580.1 GWxTD domain-containing protein [Flavobacteriales bacterium]
MSIRWTPIAVVTAGLLAACGSRPPARTGTADNLAYLYGQESSSLEFKARVHHLPDEASVIFFSLRTRDLLYKGDGDGPPYRAAVRVTYEALSDWNARTLLDSASTVVRDAADGQGGDQELIGRMDLRRNERSSFVLRITAHDLNRNTRSTVLIDVDRANGSVRQDFLPMERGRDLPYFDDHFGGPTAVRVHCPRYAGRTLLVAHYHQDHRLPSPVFTEQGASDLDLDPDTGFSALVDTNGDVLLDLGRPGCYHLRPDSTRSEGYSLFVLGPGHPYVADAAGMVPPLRYITSMQEFDRISQAGNIRQAVERFWQDAAGDRERARAAIRAYYQRVESANRFFTAHVEGWRTDRGLVHIIFGTPTTIYRSARGETWIYGEESNLMSTTFTFVRRSSPFSENDLVLERDPLLKGAWYRNVESWRNGRILQN